MQGRPTPAEIYLDATIFVAAMIDGTPHSQASLAFCSDLIAANTYEYLSQLVRLELPQALRRLATHRTNLPQPVREPWRLDQ